MQLKFEKRQNSEQTFESQTKTSFKHAMRPARGHEIGKELQHLFWRRLFWQQLPYICNIFLQTMAQAMS